MPHGTHLLEEIRDLLRRQEQREVFRKTLPTRRPLTGLDWASWVAAWVFGVAFVANCCFLVTEIVTHAGLGAVMIVATDACIMLLAWVAVIRLGRSERTS